MPIFPLDLIDTAEGGKYVPSKLNFEITEKVFQVIKHVDSLY